MTTTMVETHLFSAGRLAVTSQSQRLHAAGVSPEELAVRRRVEMCACMRAVHTLCLGIEAPGAARSSARQQRRREANFAPNNPKRLAAMLGSKHGSPHPKVEPRTTRNFPGAQLGLWCEPPRAGSSPRVTPCMHRKCPAAQRVPEGSAHTRWPIGGTADAEGGLSHPAWAARRLCPRGRRTG